MNDKIFEDALREVLDEDQFNEFVHVHRYFGKKKDLEYLWEVKVKNKELFYHKIYPLQGSKTGEMMIEIWDRKLPRKGFEDWTENDE